VTVVNKNNAQDGIQGRTVSSKNLEKRPFDDIELLLTQIDLASSIMISLNCNY
jgi:hypothetical protein